MASHRGTRQYCVCPNGPIIVSDQSIESISMSTERHVQRKLQSRDLRVGDGEIAPQLRQPARVHEVRGADPACTKGMRIGGLRGHVGSGSRESNRRHIGRHIVWGASLFHLKPTIKQRIKK